MLQENSQSCIYYRIACSVLEHGLEAALEGTVMSLWEMASCWLQVEVTAVISPWGTCNICMVDDGVLQGCDDALVRFLEG